MKRLFQVNSQHFTSKEVAKGFRDQLNEHGKALFDGKEITLSGKSAYVSKGPDHSEFGVKRKGRTHSHNAKSGGAGNGFPNPTKRRG